MGLEALSRGAEKATFVDSSREAIQSIHANLKTLKMEEQAQVFSGDVFRILEFLMKRGSQFDIIYADPPYGTFSGKDPVVYSEKVIRKIDEGSVLKEGGMLFIEESAQAQVELSDLKFLKLLNSRRMGRSILQHYQKI